ncbi:MAG: hypothetical protein JXR70_09855 [Spirochaetales bacterium]|nr:hypothetical protein [Spirochaetales bacterium]
MPVIFKNIRRKLAAQNKAAAYIRYAIGEILLIVIGILIALAINKWRAQQKQNTLELTILSQIKDRVQSDSLDLQRVILDMEEINRTALNLKRYMKEGKPYTDTLKTSFSRISFFPDFHPDQTPFDRLLDAGINIVKNDSLRSLIPRYFRSIIHYEKVFQTFPIDVYFRNKIYPKYFKSFSWDPQKGCVPKDYRALTHSDNFFVALDYVINDSRFYKSVYLQVARRNARLLKLLKKELRKRKE